MDMIATGTDIRPLEIVFFMRTVRSRGFFEQMKGRGTRVITPDDLQAVTPDARWKTHFIIVDAVGLSEEEMSDTRPLERKRTVSFEKLLEVVSFGNREPDRFGRIPFSVFCRKVSCMSGYSNWFRALSTTVPKSLVISR